MWVCGRSLVPLPASGMTTFMRLCLCSWRVRSLASVTVLESYDVVEVRSRDLENVAIGDGFHLMYCTGRDAERFADPESDVDGFFVLPHAIDQLTGQEIDSLVLDVVILHGQGLTSL